MKSSAVPIVSVRKTGRGCDRSNPALYFCSGGTEGDIGVCKNCLNPKTAAFGRRQKLEMLEKESQRILNIKVKLYDSFAEEILDRTEFETFKAKYDQSLEEIRQAMECQQREIRNLQETLEKQQEWLEYFLEYRDRTEVDRLMLVNLVKRIEVYEQKRIIIHFWFEDEFEKVLGLLETVNRAKPARRVEAFLKGKGAEASA